MVSLLLMCITLLIRANTIRLVTNLGLKSDLASYKVPTADLPKIAGGALGGIDSPDFPKVIKLLESLYP